MAKSKTAFQQWNDSFSEGIEKGTIKTNKDMAEKIVERMKMSKKFKDVTGDLRKSIHVGKVDKRKSVIAMEYYGYFVEFGSPQGSGKKPKKFIRPAVNAVKRILWKKFKQNTNSILVKTGGKRGPSGTPTGVGGATVK